MKEGFVDGEYYHVFNRGVRKVPICHDRRDYVRLIYLLLHFQGDYYPTNIAAAVSNFLKKGSFGTSQKIVDQIDKSRNVCLIAFTIMSNHLHVGVMCKKDGGVSKYMQRVLNAYTKYYNEKYKQTGHLFKGKFGRVHVKSNKQFLYLSAYIHVNQIDIKGWKNKEIEYPWSSFRDYRENRWGTLLDCSHVLDQFDGSNKYIEWVRTGSGAKGIGPEF